jgi:hypothetical protein
MDNSSNGRANPLWIQPGYFKDQSRIVSLSLSIPAFEYSSFGYLVLSLNIQKKRSINLPVIAKICQTTVCLPFSPEES